MSWEPYDKPHPRLPEIYASLRKGGTFHLSKGVTKHMGFPSEYPYKVEVFVDRAEKRIGFKAVAKDTNTPNAHRLDSSGDISLATLRDELQLEVGRYPVRFEGDMVIIDCSKKES